MRLSHPSLAHLIQRKESLPSLGPSAPTESPGRSREAFAKDQGVLSSLSRAKVGWWEREWPRKEWLSLAGQICGQQWKPAGAGSGLVTETDKKLVGIRGNKVVHPE